MKKIISIVALLAVLSGVGFFVAKKFFPSKPRLTQLACSIQSFKGDVTVSSASDTRDAAIGMPIQAGMRIETGPKSTVMLAFSGEYAWKLRLAQNSEFIVDDLMKKNAQEEESSLFSLLKGAVLLSLDRQEAKVNMRVKTVTATFGLRGTKLAIQTDGPDHSVLSVQEGQVETENFKTLKKSSVSAGEIYAADGKGKEKVELRPDLIGLYDWNLESDTQAPELETMLEKVGMAKSSFDYTNLDTIVMTFKAKQAQMQKEYDLLKYKTEIQRQEWTQEQERIKVDITCLQTSANECQLSSEKVLTKRGFPRLWGTPSYKQKLVENLQLYTQEKEADQLKAEEALVKFDELLRRRLGALSVVEKKRQEGIELETLEAHLQDPSLSQE